VAVSKDDLGYILDLCVQPADSNRVSLLPWMQAQVVLLHLQVQALRKLQQGRQAGQLIALSASLASTWGDGAQLDRVRERLDELMLEHDMAPGEQVDQQIWQRGLNLLKAENTER
jgi:hypothetical protein